MTSVFFICDNSTQSQVLSECGVKNVSLSYKFVKNKIKDFKFESILLNTGSGKRNFTPEEYYEFVKANKGNYTMALQYDEPGEIMRTISYYHMALGLGLDDIVPILHEDYQIHLNYIKSIIKTNQIALGKCEDQETEDHGFDNLPKDNMYHGLGKFRWLKNQNKPSSIDTISWLNPVRNGKLYCKTHDGYEEISIRDIKTIQGSMEECKDFVDKCGLKISQIAAKDHKALLKASLCLHYMPKLSDYDILGKNFS